MVMTDNLMDQAIVEGAERTRRHRQLRGHVRVFGNWCKGCGLCIAFCPQQVFAEDAEHRPVVAHAERCVACEWCTIHCPDFAIVVDVVQDTEEEAVK